MFVGVTVGMRSTASLSIEIASLDDHSVPEALEASDQGVAEVVETTGLVRVITRGEVNSIPVPRDCVLKVTQLPRGD
jgi:hypothetical protein